MDSNLKSWESLKFQCYACKNHLKKLLLFFSRWNLFDTFFITLQTSPGQLSWESVGLLSRTSRVKLPAEQTFMVLKYLRRKCRLCNDICKRLDFLVFSDKDEKPYVSSYRTFTHLVLLGRKRTHTTVFKKQGSQTLVVWSTSPWLDGLSVRRGLDIGITS